MDLTYLDVHDHSSLGDGTINICADNSGNGFLYSKEKISNAIWTKGTNLKTFIAYNCNIRGYTNSNGTSYTYMLGNKIPDGSKIVSYYVWSSETKMGTSRVSFSLTGENGTVFSASDSNSTSLTDWDGSCGVSGTKYWRDAKGKCDEATQISVKASSTKGNRMKITCYPFG